MNSPPKPGASLWARTQDPGSEGSPLPRCTDWGAKAAPHQHLAPSTPPAAQSHPHLPALPQSPSSSWAVGADRSPCPRAHTLTAHLYRVYREPPPEQNLQKNVANQALVQDENRPCEGFCCQSLLRFLIKTMFEIRRRKGQQQLPADQKLTGIQARCPEIILLVALN